MPVYIWQAETPEAAGPIKDIAKPLDWTAPPDGWGHDLVELAMWDDAPCPPGVPGSCMVSEVNKDDGGPAIIFFSAASSALDIGRELGASGGLQEWDSVIVGSQWAGRGQLRRGWHSPEGNMYVGWRIPSPAGPGDELASIVTGVALAEAFSELGIELELKWPNDLVLMQCEGRPVGERGWGLKVGGILLEERGGVLIAGIGVNLNETPPAETLRDGHAVPAGCLVQDPDPTKRRAGPLALWQAVAPAARRHYEELAKWSAAEVVERAEARLAWKGRPVSVWHESSPKEHLDFDKRAGTIVGLTVHGAIRIAFDDGEKTFSSAQLTPLES